MSEILTVKNLSKNFGGVQAVHEVDFTINEGEIVGLIGPNGAGKTTLFNLVNGVIRPDSGKIVFQQNDITAMAPYRLVRKGLARTHQIVKPLNELSVLENVTVGACFGASDLSIRAAQPIAMDVLRLVELDDRADSLAGNLNIAGKKRLELARAVAAQPALLLLDEVLAGLNPTEVGRMIDVVRRLRDERGITIMMIEHLMQVIMGLSGRVMVLNFGTLLASGTPEEIANDPVVIEAYLGDPDFAEKLLGVS